MIPPYGVTVGSKGPALSPEVVAAMQDIGLGTLRFQVPWEIVEQSKGVYTWGLWDDAVAKCNAAHLSIILTIKQPPAFWQTHGLPDPQGTAQIAKAIATRYAGKLAGIEIGNEDYDGGPDTSPAPLAASLKVAYPAIKAVQPDLPVLMGAILQRNAAHIKSFMDGLWEQAEGYFDVANFHFYTCIPGNGHFDPSDSSVPNVPSLEQFIALLAASHTQAGHPNFPTRCTEFGFAVTSNFGRPARCVTDQQMQWQYLKYCYDQFRASGFLIGADVFTLGAAASPDGMSLIQGSTKTLAYQQLKAYIAQHPSFGSAGGSGGSSSGSTGEGSSGSGAGSSDGGAGNSGSGNGGTGSTGGGGTGTDSSGGDGGSTGGETTPPLVPPTAVIQAITLLQHVSDTLHQIIAVLGGPSS